MVPQPLCQLRTVMKDSGFSVEFEKLLSLFVAILLLVVWPSLANSIHAWFFAFSAQTGPRFGR